MCCSCNCQRPTDPHADARNLTMLDLTSAADAAGISVKDVAKNISKAVNSDAAKGDERGQSGLLLKADDEKRVATYVAYPVEKADVAVAADGHIDFASRGVVEEAAWNWMVKGARLGLWHKEPTAEFECVESATHHGPDWVVKAVDGSERRIVDGDWLITVRAKTPSAWKMIKDGLIGGASPQGGAARRTPSAEALASLRSN